MAWKYQKGTESKKHMRDPRNDDYSDYGNIGPTRATSGTRALDAQQQGLLRLL
jgi:hypothetical protein